MKKIAVIAALAAAFAVSCGKEAEEIRFEDGVVPIRLETGIGSFGYEIRTKSGLDSMIEHGFGLMGFNTGVETFDAGQPQGLVFDNYKLVSSDGTNWNYAGDVAYWNRLSTERYTFLAYHPYDNSHTGTDISVPAGEKIDDCIDYMVAEPVVDITARDPVKLAFTHIFPKINTEIVLVEAYQGQSYTLKEIKFSGVQEYESFSLATNEFKGDMVSHDIVSGDGNISNATMFAKGDKAVVDPIYISPYAYASEGGDITVSFSFDFNFTEPVGGSTVKSFVKDIVISNDFERNHEYNIIVAFTPDREGGIEMAVTASEYSVTSDLDIKLGTPQDKILSGSGTANSYIVPEEGEYQFDAIHKGNSTSEKVGDIASVKVMWESFGTEEAVRAGDLVSDLRYDKGIVYFTASEKKGNALIAAFDGPDGTGNILWSWHIWLTDKPLDQVYNNGAGIAMDRNLGATSALKEDGVKTYGLLYQWGRKDPFLNAGSTTGAEEAANTGKWPSPVINRQTSSWVDLNPMTHISIRPGNSGDNFSWIDVPDAYRWMTPDGGKAVYDPCPPGYRVPAGNTEESFYSIASNDFSGNMPVLDSGVDFGFSETDICFTSDQTCWYPITGVRTISNYGQMTKDRMGTYWLGNTDGNWDGYLWYIYNADMMTVAKHAIAQTYSVRCVKE